MVNVDNVKIALMMKMVRGTLDMSQADFADWLDVSRSSITRAESTSLPLKAPVLMKIIRMTRERGIIVDIGDEIVVRSTDKYIKCVANDIEKEN